MRFGIGFPESLYIIIIIASGLLFPISLFLIPDSLFLFLFLISNSFILALLSFLFPALVTFCLSIIDLNLFLDSYSFGSILVPYFHITNSC